eukprot:GHVN01086547.1.p1 GENE.GHVN01086547.1~~GHVN01086547.1.p1  ORF type:complete len:273 (+),score=39.14 GHVN01086547.1:281-1099(+)
MLINDGNVGALTLKREPLKQIVLTTLTYTGSLMSTNYALSHVNYPTQVIVKSAKMVPIVVGGFIVFRRRYPLYEYVSTAVVTVSLVMFNWAKIMSNGKSEGGDQSLLGLFFLLMSLICDGLTGPRQDKILSRYNLTSLQLMFHTNLFASIWSCLVFLSIEGIAPLVYVFNNSVGFIGVFGLCSALGQIFIFMALRNFGSLHLALITTTRKFFTVLLSVLWFRHNLSLLQWAAVILMFSALLSHAYKHNHEKTKKKLNLVSAIECEKKEEKVK